MHTLPMTNGTVVLTFLDHKYGARRQFVLLCFDGEFLNLSINQITDIEQPFPDKK